MKQGMINMISKRNTLVLFVALATGAGSLAAQQAAQPTFPSAMEAGDALMHAVQKDDGKAIAKILGGPTELASSGDAAQDKADHGVFIEKYQQMHRVSRDADGSMTLYIGAENWPFPIPLVQTNGAWRFDPEAGQKEVLFRRIGENELAAIEICHQLAAAEKQYRANPNAPLKVDSALRSLVSSAGTSAPAGKPVLVDGYYFEIAAPKPNSQLAFVAYPAEYRSSGVITFLVNTDGAVAEKDLGAGTLARATALAAH
jgi:Protein of unknown function (DUF2950)